MAARYDPEPVSEVGSIPTVASCPTLSSRSSLTRSGSIVDKSSLRSYGSTWQHVEIVLSHMVLCSPNASEKDSKRAAFLLWKNYAKKKILKRAIRTAELTEKLRKETEIKNRILASSFNTLGSMIVFVFGITLYYIELPFTNTYRTFVYCRIGFFLLILYANYLMFEPYLIPMLLSLLVAIPLGLAQDYLVGIISSLEIRLGLRGASWSTKLLILCIPVICLALSAVLLTTSISLFSIAIIPLSMIAIVALCLTLKSQREFLVTATLIVWLMLLVLFPLYYVLKSCLEESVVATNAIVDFINKNNDVQEFLQDYKQSQLYRRSTEYAASWGWDTSSLSPDALKQYLANVVQLIGQNINLFFGSAFNVVSNIGNVIFSQLIFLTSLFTFLLNKQRLWSELSAISPFTTEENTKLYQALGSSVSRIFVCSFIIATVNFWSCFLSFTAVGLEVKYVFAALSAFLSIVPIFSTWIVWIPAACYLWIVGSPWGAITVAVVQIVTTYIIQPQIFSYVPGNPYYVGLSVVLGISTFGVVGAVLGPLLAGLVITSLDIYKSFYQKAQMSSQQRLSS